VIFFGICIGLMLGFAIGMAVTHLIAIYKPYL
jgi:hypothetical protein